MFLIAFVFCRGNVVAAVLSDSTQHTNTHLVSATEQLQTFLVLWANLSVQMTHLIYEFVPLEGR